MANADDEEKDIWPADLDKDGWTDVIVVRKEPFSAASEPPKSDLLLINQEGVLVDMTADLAPEFISNPSFARDVYVVDVDGDSWDDVVIVNTFNQQPMLYMNLGEDGSGQWLGLSDESATRLPTLTSDQPLICAVWAGDLTGNGAQDLYFVNYRVNSGGGTAKDFLLINDGTGHFTDEGADRAGNLLNSAFGTAGQIHDMDGDGDLDIVKNTTLYNVSPWNSRGVIVLFNDGTGNFPNWQNLVPNASPYMFEVVDFNGDGLLDLYVVDDGSDKILTATSHTPDTNLGFNTVNLGFSSSNGFGGNVHAADLDLDGDLDVVVSDVDVDIPPCNSSRRMAIYENNAGTFSDPYGSTAFDWVTNSYDVALLDINNDGLTDIFSGKCAGYDVIMSTNCELAAEPCGLRPRRHPRCLRRVPDQPKPRLHRTCRFPAKWPPDTAWRGSGTKCCWQASVATSLAPPFTPATSGTAPCSCGTCGRSWTPPRVPRFWGKTSAALSPPSTGSRLPRTRPLPVTRPLPLVCTGSCAIDSPMRQKPTTSSWGTTCTWPPSDTTSRSPAPTTARAMAEPSATIWQRS